MRSFEEEMRRGLDEVVVVTNSREWVNKEDKVIRETRETPVAPVEQEEVKRWVTESVDGLPVKDKNLVEDTVEGESVPDGNIREVMDWVDEDVDRAKVALEEENNRENPRKTLIERLEEIVEG